MTAASGALWIYVLALLTEWRLVGLQDAGRRALVGLLLAVAGVLFLGIGLGAWASIDPSTVALCVDGAPAVDGNALPVRAVAALGLALVPLAGLALRFVSAADPPLSAAAASVAAAVWFQPVLPALGWLPLSFGGGAPLALLLTAALMLLTLVAGRGPASEAGGHLGYLVLCVGGCIMLGVP